MEVQQHLNLITLILKQTVGHITFVEKILSLILKESNKTIF